MLLQPWFQRDRMGRIVLRHDLRTLEIGRQMKRFLTERIDDYVFCGGALSWRVEEIPKLQEAVKAVLGISKTEFESCIRNGDAEAFHSMVSRKTRGLSQEELDEVCNVLTKVEGNEDEQL